MEAAGIEPGTNIDATRVAESDYAICPECGAAYALHGSGSNLHELSPLDADLQEVISAWDTLSMELRKALWAIVASQQRPGT